MVDLVVQAAVKVADKFNKVRTLPSGHRCRGGWSDTGELTRSAPVQTYYAALDAAPGPARQVLAFYSPDSRIAWNGNAIPYHDMPVFIERMPKSSHNVTAYDVHPIPRWSLCLCQMPFGVR